jgi:hypothetical protein
MPSNPRATGPGLLRLVADGVRQCVFGGLAREETQAALSDEFLAASSVIVWGMTNPFRYFNS